MQVLTCTLTPFSPDRGRAAVSSHAFSQAVTIGSIGALYTIFVVGALIARTRAEMRDPPPPGRREQQQDGPERDGTEQGTAELRTAA